MKHIINVFAQFAVGYADEEAKEGGPKDRIKFIHSLAREFGGRSEQGRRRLFISLRVKMRVSLFPYS